MKKKLITLICGSRDTGDALSEQLITYLRESFDFQLIVLDESYPDRIKSHLIIFSSSSLEKEARQLIQSLDAEKFIVGKRTISHHSIDALVSIPAGSPVLFINDDKISSEECIQALKEIGFNQFLYHPAYPPLLETKDLKIAITAGESHLVPDSVEKVYDLGSRIFDYSTIASIFTFLKVPLETIEAPSFRYLKKIVTSSAKISSYWSKIRKLNNQLLLFIEESGEGLLTYDESGLLLMVNENLRKSLFTRVEAEGKNIQELFSDKEISRFLLQGKREDRKSFPINNQYYLIKKTFHENSSTYIGSFKRIEATAKETSSMDKITVKHFSGRHSDILTIKDMAGKLTGSNLNVLIEGEKSTGKHLLCQIISSTESVNPKQRKSIRIERNDISSAFSEIQSFLTSQTNAILIISEIGLLSLKEQESLYHLLIDVSDNMRVLSTSSEPLDSKVEQGLFHKDLYFFLKESYLQIPPLRERENDIILLLKKILERLTNRPATLDQPLCAYFKSYHWPGNMQELQNIARTLVTMNQGSTYGLNSLPKGMIRIEEEVKESVTDLETAVLSVLIRLNRENQVASRKKVLESLKEKGFELTESKMRTLQKRLILKGFIQKEAGRYGMVITEKAAPLMERHFNSN